MQKNWIDKASNKVKKAFSISYAQSLLLLVMVVVAMVWANSGWHHSYHDFFHKNFIIGFEGFKLDKPLHIWINDGLMALFFFIVGLEIKEQILEGELSSFKKASLPIIAAVGGMLLPAGIFIAINYGGEAQGAWGIPMATDIAFAIGFLGFVGDKISQQTKVFLTSLATVDDIGAILVIAIFLSSSIDLTFLILGAVYLGVMLLADFIGVRNMWFYMIVGVLGLWLAMYLSGVHATLAGVLAALTIPADRKIREKEYHKQLEGWAADFDQKVKETDHLLSEEQTEILQEVHKETKRAGTPLQEVKAKLSPFVNYFVLPLFALCNAGVRLEGDLTEVLLHPLSIGIIIGLIIGKVIGISGLSLLMIKSKFSQLPKNSTFQKLMGTSFFAGIGFTMSLFIADLALEDEDLLSMAKIAILFASVLAVVLGLVWFYLVDSGKESTKS